MNASQRFQHRLAELTTRGTRIVTVTVVACPGRAAGVTRVGAKMVVGERGRLLGDLGDGELERRAIGYARAMLDSKLPPPRLVGWSPGEERPSANQT
ncbi:MAG: XdhC family protein, partial [Planctomycetota bacterium]